MVNLAYICVKSVVLDYVFAAYLYNEIIKRRLIKITKANSCY